MIVDILDFFECWKMIKNKFHPLFFNTKVFSCSTIVDNGGARLIQSVFGFEVFCFSSYFHPPTNSHEL